MVSKHGWSKEDFHPRGATVPTTRLRRQVQNALISPTFVVFLWRKWGQSRHSFLSFGKAEQSSVSSKTLIAIDVWPVMSKILINNRARIDVLVHPTTNASCSERQRMSSSIVSSQWLSY